MGLELAVEMVEHQTRLNLGAALGQIQVQQAAQMFAVVYDQASTHGLPALAGATTARQYGDAEIAANRHRLGYLMGIAGQKHAHWRDLVHRCVGSVAAAVSSGKQHLALGVPAQAFGQAASDVVAGA